MAIAKQAASTEEPRIRVILKADTSGSLEAMEALLKSLVDIGEASVGEIGDSDVKFAKSTKSVIVGFKVEAGKSAVRLADAQQVSIITSDIIYKLVDAVSLMLKTGEREKMKASLEILAVFSAARSKKTVGGKVLEGVLKVGNAIEIERSMEVVGKGKVINLQHNKEKVREVPEGSECGLVVETGSNIEVGDILRAT